MKMRSIVLAALLLAPAPVALAQAGGYYGNTDAPRYTRYGDALGPGYGYGGGGLVCQKMCPHDDSPCDPIYFKIADGRCNGTVRGGRR